MIEEFAAGHGFHDPEKTILWLASSIKGQEAMGDLAAVASYWAEIDPLKAIQELEGMGPEISPVAVGSAVNTWASNDPEAALQWIDQVNDPSAKAQYIQSAHSFWAMNDPEKAIENASALQDDQLRDNAFIGVTEALSATRPGLAFQTAARISDPGKRSQLLGVVVMDLVTRDSSLAQRMIQEAPLSDAEKQGLLDQVRGSPTNNPGL
jgi:hypothetical protein